MCHQDPPSPPGLGVQVSMGSRVIMAAQKALHWLICLPRPDYKALAWFEDSHLCKDAEESSVRSYSFILLPLSSFSFPVCVSFLPSRFIWSSCSTPSVPSKVHNLVTERGHQGHPSLIVQDEKLLPPSQDRCQKVRPERMDSGKCESFSHVR